MNPVGDEIADLSGYIAVVDQRVLHAYLAQDVGAIGVAGGGQHGHAESTGKYGRRHAD